MPATSKPATRAALTAPACAAGAPGARPTACAAPRRGRRSRRLPRSGTRTRHQRQHLDLRRAAIRYLPLHRRTAGPHCRGARHLDHDRHPSRGGGKRSGSDPETHRDRRHPQADPGSYRRRSHRAARPRPAHHPALPQGRAQRPRRHRRDPYGTTALCPHTRPPPLTGRRGHHGGADFRRIWLPPSRALPDAPRLGRWSAALTRGCARQGAREKAQVSLPSPSFALTADFLVHPLFVSTQSDVAGVPCEPAKSVILSPKAFGRSELRAYASGRSAFGLTVSIPPDFRPHRGSRIPGSSVRPIQRKTLAISRIHLQRHCLSEIRSSFVVRLYLRLSDVRVDDRSFRWTCWTVERSRSRAFNRQDSLRPEPLRVRTNGLTIVRTPVLLSARSSEGSCENAIEQSGGRSLKLPNARKFELLIF
jgi:hypothetical protein